LSPLPCDEAAAIADAAPWLIPWNRVADATRGYPSPATG
jgi:hypothetical protein